MRRFVLVFCSAVILVVVLAAFAFQTQAQEKQRRLIFSQGPDPDSTSLFELVNGEAMPLGFSTPYDEWDVTPDCQFVAFKRYFDDPLDDYDWVDIVVTRLNESDPDSWEWVATTNYPVINVEEIKLSPLGDSVVAVGVTKEGESRNSKWKTALIFSHQGYPLLITAEWQDAYVVQGLRWNQEGTEAAARVSSSFGVGYVMANPLTGTVREISVSEYEGLVTPTIPGDSEVPEGAFARRECYS